LNRRDLEGHGRPTDVEWLPVRRSRKRWVGPIPDINLNFSLDLRFDGASAATTDVLV
jgi:hypothetical protein